MRGNLIARAQRPLPSRFPEPGWVEQSGADIWETQLGAVRDVARQVGVAHIRALALANQRETALLWDRETLQPAGPAIVWQCRRTATHAAALEAMHGAAIRARTGLRPDAYFSGPKFAWLLDHVDAARDRASAGDLVAGTVDAWLLANLTGARAHATDVTNASRTMLWHLGDESWDETLCEWQRVPTSLLPEVSPSAAEFGLVEPSLLGGALPILAVAGDQQAALYGHGITEPGSAKCTYGTGAFTLSHAGSSAQAARVGDGLLLTAAAVGGFAYEGGVFTAGSLLQWLRDELRLAPSSSKIATLAERAASSAGVVLIPALAGLGAPHWIPDARGAILGITSGTSAAQIARAALEAIAFRVREIVAAMEQSGHRITELRVDGGMTASDVLMQIQANALQRPVIRPAVQETTALGAARLAMRAAGIQDEIAIAEQRFEPDGDLEREFARWTAARQAIADLSA